MKRLRILAIVMLVLASSGFGYRGIGVAALFADFTGLGTKLTELNRAQPPSGVGGTRSFVLRGPLWGLSGHAGTVIDDLTLGGNGAVAYRHDAADSLAAELMALSGSFEVGYRVGLGRNVWLRTCLDFGGGTWLHYAHRKQLPFGEGFTRWFLGWGFGVAPGLELAGWLRCSERGYIGLYAKSSYLLPLHGPGWKGHENPPAFRIEGVNLDVGIRFGRLEPRAVRL